MGLLGAISPSWEDGYNRAVGVLDCANNVSAAGEFQGLLRVLGGEPAPTVGEDDQRVSAAWRF